MRDLQDQAIQTGDDPHHDDIALYVSPYDLELPLWVPRHLTK